MNPRSENCVHLKSNTSRWQTRGLSTNCHVHQATQKLGSDLGALRPARTENSELALDSSGTFRLPFRLPFSRGLLDAKADIGSIQALVNPEIRWAG